MASLPGPTPPTSVGPLPPPPGRRGPQGTARADGFAAGYPSTSFAGSPPHRNATGRN